MKTQTRLCLTALLLGCHFVAAQTSTFTYQGRLNDGINPANGNYDLTFTLYGVSSGGSIVAGPSTNSPTSVSNGIFTVALDFGAGAFPGADRWLEIGVRTNGGSSFTNLTPRQQITSAPYALQALNTANYAGAILDSQLSANVARLNGSNFFSGSVRFTNVNDVYTGSFSGNGAGITNVFLTALNANFALSWPGSFALASSPAVGNAPRVLVAGDFNGDGKLDLATVNTAGNSVSVLTNAGGGNFVLASTIGVPVGPRSIVAADVNGDGKLDLVTTSQTPGTATILTNAGNGLFVASGTNSVLNNVQFGAVADFNGDNRPDIVVVCAISPGSLVLLTNNGAGVFTAASTNSTGNNPFHVAVADVNGDNKLDLITSINVGSGGVTISTNDGNGNFVISAGLSAGSQTRAVAVGDFNGDGRTDFVSANFGGSTVVVFTNDGSGNFTATQTNSTPNPIWVTVADLNSDGKLDFVVANNTVLGTITGYTNDGTGAFFAAFTNAVGTLPFGIVAGDFNGDGKTDLASANNVIPGSVSVLLQVPKFAGNGAGLFNISADSIVGGLTTNVAVLVPGGLTNVLSFTNGILRGVQ